MKKLVCMVLFCIAMNLLTRGARAEILFKEDFEGTKSMAAYNQNTWATIPGFTSSDWGSCVGILKDTTVPHSGKQCAKLYGDNGDWACSEMYNGGTLNKTEIWVSWWERLSSGYHIDTNHKWFLTQLVNTSGDYYTNFQCDNGGTDTTARMRVYSQPLDALYGYANMLLPTNTWYQLKVHYKLNAPGSSDGIAQMWIRKSENGSWEPWQNYSGVNIRGSNNANIDSIRIGGTRSGYPSHGVKYVDDVIIATTEAEVDGSASGGGSAPDTTPPATVKGLRITP